MGIQSQHWNRDGWEDKLTEEEGHIDYIDMNAQVWLEMLKEYKCQYLCNRMFFYPMIELGMYRNRQTVE